MQIVEGVNALRQHLLRAHLLCTMPCARSLSMICKGPSDKSDQAVIEWVKTMDLIFLGLFLNCSTIPLLQTASFSKRTMLGLTALKMRQNVLTVVCQKLPVALRMRPTLVFLQFHIMRLWSASGHPRFIATAEPSNDHKFRSRARRGLLYFSNFGFNA